MNFTSRIVTHNTENILRGLYKAADIVTSTMGGAGKNVVITNNKDHLVFTKDGVSVAKSIRFENVEENAGAQLLINATKKTVEDHGDGTTLTSLLTKRFAELIKEQIDNNLDIDVNELLEKVKADIEIVKQELRIRSKKIDSNHDIYRVAYTSAKSPRLANFIAEIYSKTGLKANISLEKSRTSNSSYYDIIKGLSFDSGFVHSSFANQDSGVCSFERPFIFISKEAVTVPSDYEEIIETNFNNKTPIVFIAPSYSDAFVRYALTNIQRVGLEICLIKTPGYGEATKENLKDIVAFINSDGTCSSIKITATSFTIFNDTEPEKIKRRVAQLQAMADNAVESYDEESYLERISNLNQSSAIIYVGGITEKNAKEEYDRLEDAIGAVKSAIKGGYVRGAGVELYNVPQWNEEILDIGYIVATVCESPFYKILSNARIDPDRIKTDLPYNIRSKQYDDTLIDPTEVICSSLDNSFALVELLINTSYLIYNE